MESIGIRKRLDLNAEVFSSISFEPAISLFSQARYCSSVFPFLAFSELWETVWPSMSTLG